MPAGGRGRGREFESKLRRTTGKQRGSCSLHFSLHALQLHALPVSTSVSPPPHAHRLCTKISNTIIIEEADSYTFTSLLRLCTHRRRRRSGADGRVVHYLLLTCLSPIPTNVYVGTALMNMYSKCGMLEDAYATFVRMPHATVFTWNTIILACIHAGHTPRAIWLYITMMSEGCTTPDEVTLINIIRVFTSARDAKHGALVFAQIVMDGFQITIPLGNTLLDMYIKCERIEDAVGLFERVMMARDVISWTHMITAHISHKDALAALGYFFRLLVNGLEPDEMTFAAVLHACAMLGDSKSGKEAHSHMLESVNGMNLFIGDTLVDMYAKCGSIKDAEKVFYNLPTRSIVSWNSLLTGYVNHEHIREAFNLFCKMQCEDVEANAITFVSILNACIAAEDLEFGMAVHACAVETDFQSLTIVGNAVTNMYINCKSILDAQTVFLEMGEHSVVSWNTMISGLTKHGHALHAIDLFKRMQYSSVTPDAVTYVSVLSAIASTQNLYEGWIIHSDITEMGFQVNSFMENALIDMYSKCRSLNDAWQVFNNMSSRDIVSWNAILCGFSIEELHKEVMELFFNMKSEGMDPDHITFVRALNGCASIGCLDRGHLAHALAIEYGYDQDVFISTNIIDMYIKARSLESAQRVFDETSNQDIVSWTLILAAYIDNGQENCAFKMFCQLVKQNFRQDEFTFMNALNACAGLAAIEKGKIVHTFIVELGFEECNLVCNALIDMYSKSGSTVDAQRVLDAMPTRNVVSWNAMISGYAEHGQGETALQLVNQMQLEGISLNHISSLSVLSACSHTGLMVEGYGHLKSMNQAHGTKATMDHYACMIDLLGRTGHLEEALGLINKLPIEPSVHVWKALLRAAHIHCNLALGKMAAERVLKHDPSSATTYVMLSNIYGSLGMWNDHAQVIRTMKSRGIQKQAGCSYIEIDKQSYSFVANDTSHPQTREIYAKLDMIFEDLKVEGYEPDTSFVRYDVNEDEKELILRHHSEKLAIAFGLINTPPRTPLCIIKNLRICGDCHTASKFISKTMKREIILRDNVRFHHIKHGICSCGDYW